MIKSECDEYTRIYWWWIFIRTFIFINFPFQYIQTLEYIQIFIQFSSQIFLWIFSYEYIWQFICQCQSHPVWNVIRLDITRLILWMRVWVYRQSTDLCSPWIYPRACSASDKLEFRKQKKLFAYFFLRWLRDDWKFQNGCFFGKVPNGLWPPPPRFRKIILQIFRQKCDKSAYVHYGGNVIT